MHNSDPNDEARTVLFFDHTARLGGAELALLHLLQQLDKKRFEPVAVLGGEGQLVKHLDASNIETHILPLADAVSNARKDGLGIQSLLRFGAAGEILAYCRELSAFIKKRRVELIHTNSLKADIIGGVCAWLTNVPVVWHVHDRINPDYLPRHVAGFFRILCRVIPDFVVANSFATLDSLRLPNRMPRCVIYEGIPPREAAPKSGMALARIGLVGRLARWKGQHVFLAAAAQVRRRFPSARFQIIGSAMFGEEAYEREIRAQATDLNLDECVEFTGFRGDVPDLIDQLDVLVHASTTGEPFGQVITEGMIAGKPVVATRGGGVPEIVVHGETGLLVPMGDADAMAEAICALLENPERARLMGEAGRERALKHFTVDKTAPLLEAVFEGVLEEKKRGGNKGATPGQERIAD